jgi:hypothetical protein
MIWTLSASQRAYICMDYHKITTAQKTFHLEVGIFGQDTQTSQPLVLHCKLRASITKKNCLIAPPKFNSVVALPQVSAQCRTLPASAGNKCDY